MHEDEDESDDEGQRSVCGNALIPRSCYFCHGDISVSYVLC